MKPLLLFKTAVTLVIAILCTNSSQAQEAYKESFNVNDDVTVTVNTSHTNIVFETWNKDKVEVEAYIDGEKLSKAEKQEMFDNWDFSVLGNSNKVAINSKGGNASSWNAMSSMSMPSMEGLEFLGPMMEEMIVPMVTNMKIPNLPEDLLKDIGNIDFDYEEFQKDKEAYMEKFEAQMDKKFGKDFEVKMEKWGDEFANQYNEEKSDSIASVWESKMEGWGESFGKRMEAWGKRFEKEMEEKYGEDGNYSKKVIQGSNGNKTIIIKGSKTGKSGTTSPKGTKTIKIKMPKGAKTEIDVRHGKIEMADAVNVKATLNHSSFTANSIDGGETLINASYAPVVVNNWDNGTLYLQFVENCNIANVNTINLQASSSDVLIGNVEKEAVLAGSFGNLKVTHVSNGFKNIDILLENTDAVLYMPDTAFSFYFNGKKSTLQYPKSLQLNRTKNYNRVLVRGFNKNSNGGKNVTVNANYSNIKIQ